MSFLTSRTSSRIPITRYMCKKCRHNILRPSQPLLRFQISHPPSRHVSSESLPTIIRPSFWSAMVPKFLKRDKKARTPQEAKSKNWNPATFFILIFMLIGSQSIRMIGLRNEITQISRHSEAKLEVLKEVIDRLYKGEDVDVERLLGTGDAAKEREWEEVLREIEEEDSLWHSNRRRNKKSKKTPAPKQDDSLPVAAETAAETSEVPLEDKEQPKKQSPGNFY